MHKRSSPSDLLPVGVSIVAACLILALTSAFADKSCRLKPSDCVELEMPLVDIPVMSALEIPSGVYGSLVGSAAGAFFTFTAFNLLEKLKERREPRPSLVASFKPETTTSGNPYSSTIVECPSHVQLIPYGNSKYPAKVDVGCATYVCAKVTNEGDVACHNARAFLTSIEKESSSSTPEHQAWEKLSGYRENMELLWSHEKKEGEFIDGQGIIMPSGSSKYFDLFVAYDNYFSPAAEDLSGAEGKDTWFLKLKTVRQPPSHDLLLRVDKSTKIKWRFTIDIFGDMAEPSRIVLIVAHQEQDSHLTIYSDNEEAPQDRELPRIRLRNNFSGSSITAEITKELVYQYL
jgi:hypothetical protein